MTDMFQPDQPRVELAAAYPLEQRQAYAEQHILLASSCGFLDQTSCWRICQTYNVPHFIDHLKELRARLRTELSFSGGDK